MEWTKEKFQKVFNEVSKKAAEDPEFREKLKNDPRVTISAYAKIDIPENFRLGISDLNDYDMLLTLPRVKTEEELSDFELEMVSGGKKGLDEVISDGISKANNWFDKACDTVFDKAGTAGVNIIDTFDESVKDAPGVIREGVGLAGRAISGGPVLVAGSAFMLSLTTKQI